MFPIALPLFFLSSPLPFLFVVLVCPNTFPLFLFPFFLFLSLCSHLSQKSPLSIQCSPRGNTSHTRWGEGKCSPLLLKANEDSSQCTCSNPRFHWSSERQHRHMISHLILNSYRLLEAVMMSFEMLSVILWHSSRVREIDGVWWERWVKSGLRQPAAARLWLWLHDSTIFSLSLFYPSLTLSHTNTFFFPPDLSVTPSIHEWSLEFGPT